jgi:hypothetical protein
MTSHPGEPNNKISESEKPNPESDAMTEPWREPQKAH